MVGFENLDKGFAAWLTHLRRARCHGQIGAAGRYFTIGPFLGPCAGRVAAVVGDVLADPAADRTAGTIGVAVSLARQGVQILRMHDVGAVRQALVLHEATTSG